MADKRSENERRTLVTGGFYMTFDGPDGGGKGTQARTLDERLSTEYVVSHYREPGSTRLAERIREVLLQPVVGREDFGSIAETFLFSAARADFYDKQLLPGLEAGRVIIVERSKDSTEAYQGYAGAVDLEAIRAIGKLATKGKNPDLTFILDLDVDTSLERVGVERDRIEAKGREYHEKVREGFLEIATRDSERCVVLDATRSKEDLHKEIYKITKERIDLAIKNS